MLTKQKLEEQITQLQNRMDGLEQEKLHTDAELEQLRRECKESELIVICTFVVSCWRHYGYSCKRGSSAYSN